MIGQILRRRYLIREKLGAGGFGETYRAEYPQDLPVTPKSECVIKRLTKPETPDLDTVDRFKQEAAILHKLGKTHNQIPKLIDYFEENREFYIVQEFIDGHDLSEEIIEGNQWSETDLIQLLQEILDVLAFVHSHKFIHRDIKPKNLMRRYSDNKLVLIDFGIVKEVSASVINVQGGTSSTIEIGTRHYMPSEQLNGLPKLSSDIYALGITAIEAITGIPPHLLPKDPNTLEVIWRDRTQISNPLADILTKMVRHDFRQRYANASETLEALTQAVLPPPVPFHYGNKWGYWGYKNQTEQAVIKPEFDMVGKFVEGLAFVQIGNKLGYINKTGRVVIQPQFDEAYDFSEGLAWVKIGDKYGYIDQAGQVLIEPEFDEVGSFSEGLAWVKIGDKYGYIDQAGQVLIEPQFDLADSFSQGQAIAIINDKCGYIDKTGNFQERFPVTRKRAKPQQVKQAFSYLK